MEHHNISNIGEHGYLVRISQRLPNAALIYTLADSHIKPAIIDNDAISDGYSIRLQQGVKCRASVMVVPEQVSR